MKKYAVLIIGILFVLSWNNILGGEIIIRQEKIENNGIVVYQPNSLDLKILDIIIQDNIQTLEGYAQWLEENIKYKNEEADYWQSPEETLERKAGDCEDFAFLNEAFLRVMGHNPKAMGLLNINKRGHAICIFVEGDYYSYFSNMVLKRTQMRTIEELNDYFGARIYEIKLEEK